MGLGQFPNCSLAIEAFDDFAKVLLLFIMATTSSDFTGTVVRALAPAPTNVSRQVQIPGPRGRRLLLTPFPSSGFSLRFPSFSRPTKKFQLDRK